MLIALTHLTSPVEVGRYGLALAVTTPIVITTNLQLRNLLATDTSNAIDVNDVFRLRVLTVGFDIGVVVAVLLACGYPRQVWAIVLALLAAKEAESFSDACYGVFLRHGDTRQMVKSLTSRAVAALAVLVAALVITGSSVAAYLSVFAVWLAYGVLVDGRRARVLARAPIGGMLGLSDMEGDGRPERDLRALVRAGIPLGLSSFLIAAIASVPRLVLERSEGLEDLGVYTALSYIVIGLAVIVNAVSQLAVPRLSRAVATRDLPACRRDVYRLYFGAIALGASALLAGHLLGARALSILFGTEYSGDVGLFRWILLAGTLSLTAGVGSWVLTAFGVWKKQAVMLAGTTVLVIVASLALVPSYGATGAAWATAVAMGGQTIGALVLLGRTTRSLALMPGAA